MLHSVIASASILVTLTAQAESVSLRESTSVRVRESESESIRTTENGDESVRSYRARSETCIERNGKEECVTEESVGETEADAETRVMSTTAQDNAWWDEWKERLISAWRSGVTVLSQEADDETPGRGDGEIRERTGTRLVRRICSKVTGEERTDCVTQALSGSVTSIREELAEWIGRFYQQ